MVLVVEGSSSEIYDSDAIVLGLVVGRAFYSSDFSESFLFKEDVLGFEIGVSVAQFMEKRDTLQ